MSLLHTSREMSPNPSEGNLRYLRLLLMESVKCNDTPSTKDIFATFREVDADAFRDNATLVHEAAKRGHLETLEVLVEHGAMVNGVDVSGNTPLHYAAFHKHMDSVIFLVQMGCPLNLINKDGWTAFANAITAGHLGIVRYLHRQGAILQPGGSNHPALTSCLEGHYEVVKYLLDIPVSENFPPIPLSLALHNAAQRGHVNIGKLLLDRGPDTEISGDSSVLAMHAASFMGHTEFVRLLLEYGANVDSRRLNGFTPLMLAAGRGHVEIVRLLLQAGADPGAGNEFHTALSIAVDRGHTAVADIISRALNQ